jgi:hypothetical protein
MSQPRRLPKLELLKEIRNAAGDEKLVLWRQVEYGEAWEEIVATPEVAARLGIRPGDVIGYHQLSESFGYAGIYGLDGLVPQDFSPLGDVFDAYGPAVKAR